MLVLKKFLRWTFGVQAIVFAGLAVMLLVRHTPARNSLQAIFNIAIPILFAIIAALFAKAWIATAKPSRSPQWWAIAACAAHLLFRFGLMFVEFFFGHANTVTPSDIVMPLLNLAGLFAYARAATEIEFKPAAAPVKHAPIAGDRTARHAVKLVAGISLFAQFVSVGLWFTYSTHHNLPYFLGSAFLFLALSADFVTAIVHECAHAVVAFAFRMKMLSFRIGPFGWQKPAGKWLFKFTPAGILNLGGAVGLVPTREDQPAWHEVCVIAAGPLSNIFFGTVMLFSALHSAQGPYAASWRFIALLASSNFIAAIVNLIPFQSVGGAYSDGARILQLLTASPVTDLHKALHAIQSTAVTPRRPRDQDVHLLRRAAALCPPNVAALVLRLCVVYTYEDRGQWQDARQAFIDAERFVHRTGLDLSPELHTAFVIESASLKQNAAAARHWWDRMVEKNPTKFNTDYWLARASVLRMEGRQAEADEAWQNAAASAEAMPDAGSYNFDRDRCARLRNELDLAPILSLTPQPETSPATYSPERRRFPRATPERRRFPRSADRPASTMWPIEAFASATV